MTNALAVVTPSFALDAELFAELHRSVLTCTDVTTVHHVIVPSSDRDVFAQFEGSRCRVWLASEVLPDRYQRLPGTGWWVNVRRPWPPVRGWVLQQALKISVSALIDAQLVLIADSDVVFVRPVDVARFTLAGRPTLYRGPHPVHSGMERHLKWHGVARTLLGLDPSPPPPLPDYVCPLNVWSPAVVRGMQERIGEVTGRNWLDAFTRQLHISEFILYGLYVEEVQSAHGDRPHTDTTFCHEYWDRTPLDEATARRFADAMEPDVVGMMISAKSHTPISVRRAAEQRCAMIAARTVVAPPGEDAPP